MRLLFSPIVLPLLAGILMSITASAQEYQDYIGRDHSEGITVTTSDNFQAFGWEELASGEKTLNGSGLTAEEAEMARFMAQATFGAHPDEIRAMVGTDLEEWIDAQAELPPSEMLDLMLELNDITFQLHLDAGLDSSDFFGPAFAHFQYAWWQTNMTADDLLRQRMSYALSEIMVTSFNSVLEAHADGVTDYYDVLTRNALGNYEELLLEVSLHPAMGVYLTHFNNPRNIDSLNIHPDENYAREIMQLFSIGLYELNMDGSRVLDGQGQPIPTYDLEDINEMAKVFTGLGVGTLAEWVDWTDTPTFGMSLYAMDFTEPMGMFEFWHEPGPKHLMNGYTIPDGQSGMEDIQDAVHFLAEHPNVPPFMARRLIQHFVKSNPSPAYIERVANVFVNNGNGERGDLLATIKAVLLDEEARTCEWTQDPEHGKLKEPLVRYVQFCRSVDKYTEDGTYWNIGYPFYIATGQAPMSAQTVFNFFRPDFSPNGAIGDAGLVAPEYQIHNSRTSVAYMNEADDWTIWWAMMYSWHEVEPVFLAPQAYTYMAREPYVLVDYLDTYMTGGTMSEETRENIASTMEGVTEQNFGEDWAEYRARMAMYLLTISPEFAILK